MMYKVSEVPKVSIINHAARIKKIDNGYVLELSGDNIISGEAKYFCNEMYAPTLYGVANGLALFFGDTLSPPSEKDGLPVNNATLIEGE